MTSAKTWKRKRPTPLYVSADLLPADSAEKVRRLLRSYLDQRILFYTTRSDDQLRQINATTAKLQAELIGS